MMKLLVTWVALHLVIPAMGFRLSSSLARISSSKNLVSRSSISHYTKSSRQTINLSMIDVASSSFDFISSAELIKDGFNVVTFGPQPFWLLMCLLPNFSLTKKLMAPWTTILFFALVHLIVVFASISEPDGTAPITEVISLLFEIQLTSVLFNHLLL